MTPGRHDFEIVRGTTQPLVFRLKVSDGGDPPVLTNMPFDDVVLTIQPKNATKIIVKLSDANPRFFVSNSGEAEITFRPTAAQSRTYPLGDKTDYEVEVRKSGNEDVYLVGTITGTGGVNIDG